MQIKVYGNYCFTDSSDNCIENGELSILYDVPKSWSQWNEEKRQLWLEKNYGKITKAFEDAMCVTHTSGLYADIE